MKCLKKTDLQTQKSVIKCSLPGRVKDQSLFDSIQDWVLVISHIVNKGSLGLQQDAPPLPRQQHTSPNPQRRTQRNPLLQMYERREGNQIKGTYPSGRKHRQHLLQILPHLLLKTCRFLASRQLRYIFNWLNTSFPDGYDKTLPRFIQHRINNWSTTLDPPEAEQQQVTDFIQLNKDILQNDEDRISDVWIKKHPEHTVTYFYHILKYLERFDSATKFTLAPISSFPLTRGFHTTWPHQSQTRFVCPFFANSFIFITPEG